ncbi:MAG: hypothetical protein A2X64_08990 [Ignavibacteria bacterium GWF2_33_9]|nr:MAG: hypothetical protein A2X64_08990 [Ignavibacteria bacterium GWF2_33_9]
MKKRHIQAVKILLLLFISISIISCTKYEKEKIAISKGIGSEGYLQYGKWMKELNPEVELINLYGFGVDSALKLLNTCDGLILSGGPDVHPLNYGQPDYYSLCEIDSVRDTLEFKLIENALSKKMPILAVCRGFQIFNVYMGGTLFADLPTQRPGEVSHRCENKDACFHDVKLYKSQNFDFWGDIKNTRVNTNHHQGIDYLSEDLYPTSYAKDGLIESFEWIVPENQSYLIAVQWHPERLSDENPELSDSLGNNFLRAVTKFRKSKK